MSPLLEARVGYEVSGRALVEDVALEVPAGESLAIVGPNGAGKTTLVRLLAGLLEPTSGAVRLEGRSLGEYPRRQLARRLAYVPQLADGSPGLTVREAVLLGRYPRRTGWAGGYGRRDYEIVRRVLERVELDRAGERQVERLSGGERQAVAIAAALAQEPEVLLLDEPTTYLDPGHQRRVASLLAALAEAGTTIVFASHDLNLALALAGRVAALRAGRLQAAGPTTEVLTPEFLADLYGARFYPLAGGPVARVYFDLVDA